MAGILEKPLSGLTGGRQRKKGILEKPLSGLTGGRKRTTSAGEYKLFNGKRYRLHSSPRTKRTADETASRLRRQLGSARVVKSGSGYQVYSRRG